MEEQNSFEIILYAGNAKELAIQAISLAKKGGYQEAEECLLKAKEQLIQTHEQHKELLVRLANGEKVEVDLLMVHAEDYLSSAQQQTWIAEEMIDLYKRLEGKI